jgi:hypothetical protein
MSNCGNAKMDATAVRELHAANQERIEIRKRLSETLTDAALAKRFRISERQVSRILAGHNWSKEKYR